MYFSIYQQNNIFIQFFKEISIQYKMEQEALFEFEQDIPVQMLLQHGQIHVRIQKLSSHEIDSLTLEKIKQIKGKKIKQIDFKCDELPKEYEFKLIEQMMRLIQAQNEIQHFEIQYCEWNNELQSFILNTSDCKASLQIKFQDDEWFQQISALNLYKQWSDITFLSNSLTIYINQVGIYLQLTKRSFINSVLTQQKLKEIASNRQQKEVNFTFQQDLEDQEILNLIDTIICFKLQRVIFYKLLTLEKQNQTYNIGYHLVLKEDISQQLVQKLFKEFKIISLYSNIKKIFDYQFLLQQQSLYSFKSIVSNKHNILSLEQIKNYFQIAINHPKLKELNLSSCLDYQKQNHLKIQSQLVESSTLQEITNILAQLNSNIAIEIFFTCKNEGMFSNEKNISSENQQMLNNLVKLSKQFQKGFHLKINENFIVKTLPSQIEICNKIDNLDLCLLNLPLIQKIKIDTSEHNLQKIFEFFQKLLEENLELYSIEVLTSKDQNSYSSFSFDSNKKQEHSVNQFQLLKYIQIQNLQQIQHLNIQDVGQGSQFYFNLKQSVLLISIDKSIKNHEFAIQFLQNLIQIRTNQFSSVNYSSQLQDHQQHTIIINKLKELSHNKLIDISIQNLFKIDVQNKTIKFHSLKQYTQLMSYLNQNLPSVQIVETLIIQKNSLRPKKNTIENLINFFLESQSKIKSVELYSLLYKFDISQVLSILQFLLKVIPKFTVYNFKQQFLLFDSDKKTIITHFFNNNECFKQAFSHFNKIHLKMNNITDKANEEILALINQNRNLKEFILHVQKFDEVDIVSKIQFRSSQFENFLVQGVNFKIFLEKKNKKLKVEANSMQVIQYFLMSNTALDQDLFTQIEKIELLDQSQSQYFGRDIFNNMYQPLSYFLIKPLQITSLRLQAWQSLDSFLELIGYVSKLNLDSLILQLNVEVENKYFIQENEQIANILQNCLFHKNIKQYKLSLIIFQKNLIACEINYNQNRFMHLFLQYFEQFQTKTQYSKQQIVDLFYQFVKGFKYTTKAIISNYYSKDRSIINLFLKKMSSDLPFLVRILVKSSQEDSYYAFINQYLKLKSYFLYLIQLLKNKKINYGLNRSEKFIDLLEYFQIQNNKSIKSQDLVWDYERILQTLKI
ncbi:hypothetical protein TTHERM_00318660 (macronuclear) [Tetrahymena thermophila SB210]|uniref:Uncharacterized protein n=1 Tax=Tetrahymena thermophila (strain SB210) TaxID=312017 RepID=I7M2S4_TETTS|nr:hypothetical protein TTHERM_00318660 [Tetrahymena thermophila SB210]EAS01203.2 hypothetical protein TTHERM_00318660 [Tetrahymena thermophila SB210]|eukprot:XP_001021448.2 hypothetical protein TTHERM_00318660 [Tetrahymena thermophila SB210]